jgi:hypothetical protein
VRRNLLFKTAKHSKARVLLQHKEKNHGKADACRGFLMQHCGKRADLERINPYGSPPFAVLLLFSRGYATMAKTGRGKSCETMAFYGIGSGFASEFMRLRGGTAGYRRTYPNQ